MNEIEILGQMEQLRRELVRLDEDRKASFRLDDLKAEHRSLKSPDSPTILYLIRRLSNAQQEINRLNNIIKKRDEAEKNRMMSRSKPQTEAVA